MYKFSIIIPVHKAEKYIQRCLDSLINQTYPNIEIICVNDCLKDSSFPVLQKYAKKDNRIKIVNKIDQGVSAARNAGIDNATGDYILFADADDWLETNTCELISEQIIKNVNIDIIQYQYKKIYKNNTYYKPLEYKKNITIDTSKDIDMVLRENDTIFIWDKAYRLDFINKFKIRFENEVNVLEDFLFVTKIYMKYPKVKVLCDYLYNYYDNSESACHQDSYKRLLMHQKVFPAILNILQNDEKFKKFLYRYYLQTLNYFWNNLYFSEHKTEFIEELLNTRKFISKDNESISSKICDFNLFLAKYHIAWLYLKIIRPFGKYFIVLPYRKLKTLLGR